MTDIRNYVVDEDISVYLQWVANPNIGTFLYQDKLRLHDLTHRSARDPMILREHDCAEGIELTDM